MTCCQFSHMAPMLAVPRDDGCYPLTTLKLGFDFLTCNLSDTQGHLVNKSM